MELPKVLLVFKGIVLYKLKLLLIKRSQNTRFNPGLWEFPGGKFEAGKLVEKTLVNEIFEETGLDVTLMSKLGYVQEEMVDNEKYPEYQGNPVVRVYYLTKASTERVKLSEEHTDFKWVGLTELYESDLTDQTRKAVQALEESIKGYLWKQ